MNVYAGNDADGTNVTQHSKNNYARQRFKFNYDSDKDAYKIYPYCSSNGSGRVLDVNKTSGSVVKGTNVQIYTPSESRAQRWKIVPISGGKYRIYPRLNSSLSVAAYGSADGTSGGTSSTSAGNVYLKNYSADDLSQQWYIEPDYYSRLIADGDYYVRNLKSDLHFDATGRGTTSGTLICQYSFVGMRNQIWTFKFENGVYRIMPKHASGMSLDVSGASADNGAKLQLYTSSGTIAQQFNIVSAGMGYLIKPRTGNDKKDIVVQDASKVSGANIIQYTHNGTGNENWYIELNHINTNVNHTNSAYDREKAKTYAETYAENYNGAYKFVKDADCTNFVSQCLLFGGLTQVDDESEGSQRSTRSWYYATDYNGLHYNASHTWGVADFFCRHWGVFCGNGYQRAAMTIEYPNSSTLLKEWNIFQSRLQVGDIIQLEREGEDELNKIGHSMIVHKVNVYNNNYDVYDAHYAQHSDDKKDESLYAKLKSFEAEDRDRRIVIHIIK